MDYLNYVERSACVAFLFSAFYWFRAARVQITISGAIGGPIFTNLSLWEKILSLVWSINDDKKCFSLSAWLNGVAAVCASVGSILTFLSIWLR